MSKIKIADIVEKTGCSRQAVITWIEKGYLPAEKKSDERNSAFLIDEDDLTKFLQSEHYQGKPGTIKSSDPFTRVPILENCYPMNLLIAVREIPIEDEEYQPDLWKYDMKRFRELIQDLNDREQRIIEARYQFGMTLDECSSAFGVGRERIRQIQKKAERKLRHWTIAKGCLIVDRNKYDELKKNYDKLQFQYSELVSKYNLLTANLPVEKVENATIDLAKIGIEELDLSVRAYNCIKRAGIETLKDILDFDKNQSEDCKHATSRNWLTVRNLGRKSLMEVARKVFDFCGYRIRYCWDLYGDVIYKPIPIAEEEERVPGGVNFYTENHISHPGQH